jgi:hypothetical protein
MDPFRCRSLAFACIMTWISTPGAPNGDCYCASVERGAGSREWGFLILIFKNSDNHGNGDLLPWIMKLWIF